MTCATNRCTNPVQSATGKYCETCRAALRRAAGAKGKGKGPGRRNWDYVTSSAFVQPPKDFRQYCAGDTVTYLPIAYRRRR